MSLLSSRPSISNHQLDVASKLDSSKAELIIVLPDALLCLFLYLMYGDSYLPKLELLGSSSLNPTVFS